MALRFVILAVAVLAAGAPALEPAGAATQEPTAEESPELAEALRQYGQASQPGAEHRRLDPLAGRWRLQTSWSDADGKPVRAPGESENRWILGGRFLLCEAQSDAQGVPLESLTVFGFDARRQRFFALGLNNLGTDYLTPSGTYEPASDSFVFREKRRDEITGLSVTYRLLLRIEGPDRYTLELFVDWPGRGPQRLVEGIYTRREP